VALLTYSLLLCSTSLEINHTAKDVVKRSQVGAGVAVKIEHAVYESAKSCGRHFTEADLLVSMLSRSSIDTLKTLFREGEQNTPSTG
jgi:translation initiation factor 5B